MIRRIIRIDEDKCTGCGLCAEACHEGAIKIIDGKARLTREDYCDGLGDCLPACPEEAISFEEREAPAYDEAAVLAAKAAATKAAAGGTAGAHHSCPGSAPQALKSHSCPGSAPQAIRPLSFPGLQPFGAMGAGTVSGPGTGPETGYSELMQWPVQLKLVPPKAPCFNKAHLLIAADCTAFACGTFHRDYMQGRVTVIGCPKLDSEDYSERLAAIFANNDILDITVVRMVVPCCGGLVQAVHKALEKSGKSLPLQVITLATNGTVLPG